MLSAIHEEDFLGFSYGFRSKRSQHDALDALIVGISSKKVNYILDADIRSFFTEVSQSWVIRFLKHRVGDPRGRDSAKAQGVKMGRKPKLTTHQKREAIRRRDKDGETVRDIARTYNVSHSTISRLKA